MKKYIYKEFKNEFCKYLMQQYFNIIPIFEIMNFFFFSFIFFMSYYFHFFFDNDNLSVGQQQYQYGLILGRILMS